MYHAHSPRTRARARGGAGTRAGARVEKSVIHGTWYMVHDTWYRVHGTWYRARVGVRVEKTVHLFRTLSLLREGLIITDAHHLG